MHGPKVSISLSVAATLVIFRQNLFFFSLYVGVGVPRILLIQGVNLHSLNSEALNVHFANVHFCS